MGKQIIDLIGEYVSISGNSTIDSIIFAIIGITSFLIAFGVVGMIFDAIGLYDSDLMSGAHWSIRVVVFCGLTYIGVKIAQFIEWLFSFKWWVYVITGVVLIEIIILAYWIKFKISKNKAQQTIVVEKFENAELELKSEKTEKTDVENKHYCPRCHSKLVKRYGPYGAFYGCASFAKTGCRYTRKFL